MSNILNVTKGWLSTGLAFGKKNAPALMTGGGICLGWLGAYVLWRQSKKAEQVISKKEADLQSTIDISEDEAEGRAVVEAMKARSELPKKDKVVIYLQYCWTALALGVASTGLLIGAQKMSLDRLAEMYILTQFLEGKNEKQNKLIDKLKEKAGLKDNTKAMHDLENDLIEEEVQEDQYGEKEAIDYYLDHWEDCSPGTAHIIDHVTHKQFDRDIIEFTDGIAEANKILRSRRKKAIKRRLGDAFYSSDDPWSGNTFDEDQYGEVYSSLDLGTFAMLIGEIDKDDEIRLGELLEFRYYGGDDLLRTKSILKYNDPAKKDKKDKKNDKDEDDIPEYNGPTIIHLDYTELLSPSSELIERNPL